MDSKFVRTHTSRERDIAIDAAHGVAAATPIGVRVHLVLLEHFIASVAREEHHGDRENPVTARTMAKMSGLAATIDS